MTLSQGILLAGGRGVISVVANVVPKIFHDFCQSAINKNRVQMDKLNQQMASLYKALFCEANPIPVKWALKEMGLIKSGIRLPLTSLGERFHEQVLSALKENGC